MDRLLSPGRVAIVPLAAVALAILLGQASPALGGIPLTATPTSTSTPTPSPTATPTTTALPIASATPTGTSTPVSTPGPGGGGPATPIPTVSSQGLALLGIALASIGFLFMRRRF